MKTKGARAARLAFLFILGVLLFNYPLLALFNVQGRVFGVPVLYAYIFVAWGVLIALVALVMERDG
jgi:hypothetical protein